MSVVYWARFFREENGGYSVDVPDMPGCFTEGDTFEEAYRYLTEEAIPGWLGRETWPPARGPEEIMNLDRFADDPEPLLVRVVVGGSIDALAGPLASDLARAAAASGRPATDLLAQAAREFLSRTQ
jgi:predicted RNase H-like HicB family nuclease